MAEFSSKHGRLASRKVLGSGFEHVGTVDMTNLEGEKIEVPLAMCPKCGAVVVRKQIAMNAHRGWCEGWKVRETKPMPY